MTNGIDMVPDGAPLGRSSESTVQGGGGGEIDMLGGSGMHLSHTPISPVQKGSSASGIDMVGPQGLLSHTPTPLYGQIKPTDKGE